MLKLTATTLNLHDVPAEQFSEGCRPLTIGEANLYQSHKHPRVQVRCFGKISKGTAKGVRGIKTPHWSKWHSAYVDKLCTYQTDMVPCG